MDCSICFDPIDAESQVVSTPCGHVFHSNCMETWIAQGKQNCPQCRKVCERQNIRPIFLPFSDQENPRQRAEGKVENCPLLNFVPPKSSKIVPS
jgi:hypothetical protein